MLIRFFDECRLPFRSFKFNNLSDIIFKDYAVKIIDRNGVLHQVSFSEFSYFMIIKN